MIKLVNESAWGDHQERLSKMSPEVEEFMKTPNDSMTYKIAKNAAEAFFSVDKYIKDLAKDPSMLDDIYTAQGIFYVVYKPFVDKCNEILNDGRSISGYGTNDYEQLRIRDFCRAVDYNFPYGWKRQGKYVTEYGWDLE
jgi:hypothetical protein